MCVRTVTVRVPLYILHKAILQGWKSKFGFVEEQNKLYNVGRIYFSLQKKKKRLNKR